MTFAEMRALALARACDRDPQIPQKRVPPHWFVLCSVVPEFHAFDGAQVWCASISKAAPGGRALERERWTEGDFRRARQVLEDLVGDAGDASRQRLCSTLAALYLLRALRPDEHARGMFERTSDMMIGLAPVQVHEDVGLPERASGCPCEDPTLESSPSNPAFKLAFDCGRCVPCRARAVVRRTSAPCLLSVAEFPREAEPS